MQFDWRQTELFGNLGVLDAAGGLEGHATDELGQIAAGGDGGAAAKGLEFDVRDGVGIFVDTDLEFHDIATCKFLGLVEWSRKYYVILKRGGGLQAGAPTRPVPTSRSFLSIEPTFRGLL